MKKRTKASCIWVAGISEGGLTAILAAKDNTNICGLILMASPGRRPAAIMREQLRRFLPEIQKAAAIAAVDSLEAGKTVAKPPLELMELLKPSGQPYLISVFKHDPAALLAKLKIPVLIFQGEADNIVSLADARALAAARPDATLKILPGVNHAQRLEPAGKDAPLAPGLMDAAAHFMHEHSR